MNPKVIGGGPWGGLTLCPKGGGAMGSMGAHGLHERQGLHGCHGNQPQWVNTPRKQGPWPPLLGGGDTLARGSQGLNVHLGVPPW